jgi:DNA repair photolyase
MYAQSSMFDVMSNTNQAPQKTKQKDRYVSGCSIIYQPKGQAREYAALATNPYRGCDHGCVYCYVPRILRIDRRDFVNVTPRPNFIEKLEKDAIKYYKQDIDGQVLLSFTTDPYNTTDVKHKLTRKTIQVLQKYGLSICALTKGGSRALRDIDLFRPEKDAFASTLTTMDYKECKKWEPGGAIPGSRVETLRAFHDAGIYTWVSLEPVYNTIETLKIIEITHSFVDLYKVGRINYNKLTKTIDWKDFTIKVISVLERHNCKYYIKRDLQPYLKFIEIPLSGLRPST